MQIYAPCRVDPWKNWATELVFKDASDFGQDRIGHFVSLWTISPHQAVCLIDNCPGKPNPKLQAEDGDIQKIGKNTLANEIWRSHRMTLGNPSMAFVLYIYMYISFIMILYCWPSATWTIIFPGWYPISVIPSAHCWGKTDPLGCHAWKQLKGGKKLGAKPSMKAYLDTLTRRIRSRTCYKWMHPQVQAFGGWNIFLLSACQRCPLPEDISDAHSFETFCCPLWSHPK